MGDDIIRNGDLVEFVGLPEVPEIIVTMIAPGLVKGNIYKVTAVDNVVNDFGHNGPFLQLEGVHPFVSTYRNRPVLVESNHQRMFKKVPYLKKATKQINWSEIGVRTDA